MATLSYNDVFSPQKKSMVQDLYETREALKASNIFIAYWMNKMNLREFTIDKEKFLQVVGEGGGISIQGKTNGSIVFKLEEDPNA